MRSSLQLSRVTVLLLASITFVCGEESLQDRVNKDPLAMLAHMHLASRDDHRIPAFVITQVSHSEYSPSLVNSSTVSRSSLSDLENTNFPSPPVDPESIERSQSDEETVPVVLATTSDHVRKPVTRRHHTTSMLRTSESTHHAPRNYEELIARPYDAASAQDEAAHEAHLRSNVRSYHPITYVNEETGETVEPREVMHVSMVKHTPSNDETVTQIASTEAPVTTTTSTPVEITTTESVETTESPREIIHSNPSYISESSQSLHEDAKIPLLIPVRKRAPVSSQYTLVSTDGHGHPSYVSSDVYTIETKTKYRPRTMHSNSIFYQKALAYLKAYKKELVQRRPLGPTYRLNANSDDPSHIVTAYGEIPPVVADTSYSSESDSQSPGRANAYQQQEMEPANGPSSDESLAVTDRQREVIGYLPVVRLPRPKSSSTYVSKEQSQENIPYASASASASSSSSLSSSSSPVDESSIMGKKPISPSASSYLSPSLRLRKQSSARLTGTTSNKLVHRSNRINVASTSSSSSFGYSPISSLLEPTFPVLTVSVKRPL